MREADPVNLATDQFGPFGAFGPSKSVLDGTDLKKCLGEEKINK